MRILEINTEKKWRGGEKQTLLTTEGLLQKGHVVTLVCKKKSILHEIAISKKIPFVVVQSNIELFFYLVFNGKKFNIIHTHTAKALTPCALSAFFHNTKVIFSRRHHKAPSSILSKWKYNSADSITTVSQYIKTRLVGAGIKSPIEVIHDASILIQTNTKRIQHEYNNYLNTGKKIIATIAALEEEKDPFTLLAAIEKLSKERDDFIFLHFGSGSLEPAVNKEIKHRNLHSIYYCLGQTKDVEELYSMFDIFIMSSKNEGFGSSVIDAFLNKVPVVSTDAGGLKELVQGRGYLAETGNATDLCKQINNCLSNDSTAQINNAYAFATTELSSTTIQSQYEQLFIRLTQPTVHPT